MSDVPDEWKYVEKRYPGVLAVWLRDIKLATDTGDFIIGERGMGFGRPLMAVAYRISDPSEYYYFDRKADRWIKETPT